MSYKLAIQAFIGSSVRGAEGQFFTPTEAVRWIVNAIAPIEGEKIIDPAYGAGSFLSFSARYLEANGAKESKVKSSIYGIEKDEYLSSLAKTHLALAGCDSKNVICGDSIEKKLTNGKKIRKQRIFKQILALKFYSWKFVLNF